MMPLSDLYNVIHYQVWERRLQKGVRALSRWWRQWHRRWERWRLRRQAGQAIRREHMEAVKEGLIAQALATAVLDSGSAELQEALLAVLWERKGEELRQQALAQVRREQQEAETTRQERWEAQKARAKRELERESEALIQEGIDRGMASERQDFEERRQRLRAQRDEWKARATDAEAWIVDHIKTLLPDGRRVLLRGPELQQFRLHSLNAILSRLGWEVKARLTDTPELVATEVGPSHWEQRSRFRLVTVAPGVIDETDDEDTGTPVEVSQDGTQAAG